MLQDNIIKSKSHTWFEVSFKIAWYKAHLRERGVSSIDSLCTLIKSVNTGKHMDNYNLIDFYPMVPERLVLVPIINE